MTSKVNTGLLLFALCGIALWFAGNLYEAVVITPNLLTDPVQKIQSWQAFFTATNPVYFYIPLSPLAIAALLIVCFRERSDAALRKRLSRAIVFLLPALVLGIYIITQINLKLFFGHAPYRAANIYTLALRWNILNLVRVFLLACTIYHLFGAYIMVRKKEN